MLVLFVLNERRAKEPSAPLEIFKICKRGWWQPGLFLPITIIGATSAVVSNLVGKLGYKQFMLLVLTLFSNRFTISATMKVGGTYWANVFPGLAMRL